jgi:ABC-type molybdate transport system ATPase subunit
MIEVSIEKRLAFFTLRAEFSVDAITAVLWGESGAAKTSLLDEPFSALDRKTREWTFREFLELRDELRISVLMVTHSRCEAETLGHCVIEMNEGRTSPAVQQDLVRGYQ